MIHPELFRRERLSPFWPSFCSYLDKDRMLMLTEHLKRVDFNGEKEKLSDATTTSLAFFI